MLNLCLFSFGDGTNKFHFCISIITSVLKLIRVYPKLVLIVLFVSIFLMFNMPPVIIWWFVCLKFASVALLTLTCIAFVFASSRKSVRSVS